VEPGSNADHVTGRGLVVPESALTWRFMRSSAPGGQHVNTSSTQVELRCDLTQVRGREADVTRVRERLGDEARLRSSDHRSQLRNRADALRRMLERIDAASIGEVPRRATRPKRSAVQSRLNDKKQRSARKTARRWRPDD
jgi:ribosome-associated protein